MAPLLLLLLVALPQPLGSSGRFAQPRLRRWGAAILRHLQVAPPCAPRGGPQPECPALHVSEPAGGVNDSSPRAPSPTLLLDPSPRASFGHSLRLFHLDFGRSLGAGTVSTWAAH
ncbi:unnamed protein product [Caretta caretta]